MTLVLTVFFLRIYRLDPTCVQIQGVERLTLIGGLCWLYKPYWCYCWCPETETRSIYWAQMCRFHLKTET
jgi:hypothetical protein